MKMCYKYFYRFNSVINGKKTFVHCCRSLLKFTTKLSYSYKFILGSKILLQTKWIVPTPMATAHIPSTFVN